MLLLSSASLVVEIALTRVFSLAQGYHFAFMSVSLALLGFGVSGSLLGLLGSRFERRVLAGPSEIAAWPPQAAHRWPFLPLCALLFSVSALASYLVANHLPFDSYRIAWEPVQWAYLVGYYAVLSLPFLFAGLFAGAVLASQPAASGRLYAANLIGAALGSLVAVLALPYAGAPGEMILAAGLGLVATALLHPGRGWALALLTAATATLVWIAASSPEWVEVKLSPYQSLSQAQRYPGAHLVYGGWSPLARVDVLQSEGTRSFPGLSLGYGGPLPPQLALFVDGDGPFALTQADATQRALLDALPAALAYQLRPEPSVLLIEPHGGLDGLLAQQQGARSVSVIESDDLVARLASERYSAYLGGAYSPPKAQIIAESPRSYLARSGARYDLISLPPGGPFRPVEAGSWALAEDYLYTAEAFRAYYDHLSDGGILLVTRWLQTPPSEELRAWALVAETVEAAGGIPSQQMIAYRSWSTVSILVSRSPFQPQQIASVRGWLTRRSFDPIYYSEVSAAETNRFNQLPSLDHYQLFRLAVEGNRSSLCLASPHEVSPPTDDRPFFHHFFKWSQIGDVVERMGKTWQPFGGSGFLLLFGLLALSTLLAAAFILGPHLIGSAPLGLRSGSAGPLFYFGLLGLGFLLVEMPLIQRMVLLLGHPTRAFAATLLALLLFSGLGSLASHRFHPALACGLVALGAAIYPLLLQSLTPGLLSLDLLWRSAAAVSLLAPLGFAMGIPFPRRLAQVGERRRELVPWAWGVNGFSSVVSSIASAILAISFGFSVVLWLGAAAYALAAAEALRGERPAG